MSMVHHKSHAQEILTSEMHEGSINENIRKLALDIERLRNLYGESTLHNEELEERLKKNEDTIFWAKVLANAAVISFLAILFVKFLLKNQ